MNPDYFNGLKTRNSSIIERIYSDFFDRINNALQKYNLSRNEMQDVFQDALIIIYRKSKDEGFELTSQFYTFLYGVCQNIIRNKKRKHSESKVTSLEDKTLNLEWTNDSLEMTEQYRLYREKFKLLGEDCRKLLTMFFNGIKMKEIQQKMNFGSESYVKKKKFKCKEKLVNMIKEDSSYSELLL